MCHRIQHGYINQADYVEFLKLIRRTVGSRRIALFYDGLSTHKCARAMNLVASYRWIRLLNEAWRSQDNPIESYIGYVKRRFYKLKLQAGANPVVVDGINTTPMVMRDLINQALEKYRDFDMTRVIDGCMMEIKKRLMELNNQ